jgi:hypothetical protein
MRTASPAEATAGGESDARAAAYRSAYGLGAHVYAHRMVRHLRRPRSYAVTLVLLAAPALTVSAAATEAPVQVVPKAPHAVNLTAKLKVKPVGGAFVGTGPASGTPFGAARAKLRSTIERRGPLRTASTLTIVTTRGNAVFKGTGRYVGTTFKATMRAFSGAGTYRGVQGTNLAVTSTNRNGTDTLRMKGTVRYGAAALPEPIPTR